MKSFIAFLLICTSAQADVKALNKGDPAPYDGYLFSPDKEKEARQGLLERDHYLQLNESYQKIIGAYKANETIYEQRIENFSVQNDNLAKQLNDARSVNGWEKFGYFMLGAVLTGAISYGVIKTLK